jgi:hypothetical protein
MRKPRNCARFFFLGHPTKSMFMPGWTPLVCLFLFVIGVAHILILFLRRILIVPVFFVIVIAIVIVIIKWMVDEVILLGNRRLWRVALHVFAVCGPTSVHCVGE